MKRIVVFLLVITLLAGLTACDSSKRTYGEAATAIVDERFSDAITILDSIPDYEDVDKLREKATMGIAQELFDDGDFAGTIELLDSIPDYNDGKVLRALAEESLFLPETWQL